MHFGLYLNKKGTISAEQLVAALEAQLETLPKIGQLAIEEGIISPRGIFDVLRAQSESPNERFGEIAIEMGLMTRDELMWLLMIQTDRKCPLDRVFVAQGVLSEQQAAAEMAEFRRSNRRTTTVRASKIMPAPRRVNSSLRLNGAIAAN
jgi:hypothetical protein